MGLEAIIPHMTSNNAPAPFIASTSNQLATYAPFNAFQDNGGGWISDVANSHIQIDLGRPYKVSKVYIDTVSSWTGAHMNTLTFQASLDGINWTVLYSGATSNYKYISEQEFGIYRYWRVKAGSMTMRGGCVRYFQLYGSPLGFFDLDVNNIWVSSEPVTLSGNVYAINADMDVRVLINDVVEDDWRTFSDITHVEYGYDPSLFKEGGNVVKVQGRDVDGHITEELFLLYKLNLEAYKFNTSSFDFKIKNSPERPSTDGWLSQDYEMDYLNSEVGVSYVFRYKPYAQIDSRIEEGPRLFDRIMKENYNIEQTRLSSVRKTHREGLRQESKLSEVEEFLRAIKTDRLDSAFKELGVIQRIFDAWASMNTEDIGIKADIKNSAAKKIHIAQDILQLHSLNARRKEEIKNALTLIQGYEFSNKVSFDTIISYYRAMEEVYPHKETIITGILLNAIGRENTASKYPVISSASKYLSTAYIPPATLLGEQRIRDTWVSVLQDMKRDTEDYTGNIYDVYLGSPREKDNTYVMNQLLIARKEEMYGTVSSNSLGSTETEQGTLYDVLLSVKEQNKDSRTMELTNAYKDEEIRGVYFVELTSVNKNLRTKDFMLDGIQFVNTLDVDAYIETVREFIELLPMDATDKTMLTYINKLDSEVNVIEAISQITKLDASSYVEKSIESYFDIQRKDALDYNSSLRHVDKMMQSSGSDNTLTRFDKLDKHSLETDAHIIRIDKMYRDIRVDTSVMFIDKSDNKEAWPIFTDLFIDKMERNIRMTIMESFVTHAPRDVFNLDENMNYIDKSSRMVMRDEVIQSIDKIVKQSFVIEVMSNIDVLDKASLIQRNWDFARKIVPGAITINEAIQFSDKEEKYSYLYEEDLAYIEEKKGLIIDQLLLDHVNLNGYIMDLIGGGEVDIENLRDAITMQDMVADKDIAIGIIQEAINSNRINQEKEGYIPPNTFVLAGDGSEWDDIWNRYSPGVDILDPPDSDYDYSKLAPAIYDIKTGVPKNPIGRSNLADVYVQTATSHPIPENNEVGVDDTKRIAVDNYIFIDTVLALESIKNRQKLRYAGMPVGKTIKEVFSQLYTWIQQAAPNHPEYERMFRFSRWYAEAVVLRNSKQILHRVYNPWQSSLHMGSGLGIDHTKHGWTYMTGTGTMNTTTLSGRLIFSKENYIDSEFVLRGYFDNPAGKGTMEVLVDGVVVDSFSTHGVYERRIEILQGYHTYDIFFYGTAGSAVISSIEIGGTNFVSAHTTSDDSDVNGLKALTELMAQLLGYFELHHGGRKIKGTMEVRQRAVWNTHT